MNDFGTIPGAGQPWRQQYDFNTEIVPSSLTWTMANLLPDKVINPQAIVTKNRVYLLGGNTGNKVSDATYTAIVNEDGTLEEWTIGTSLPIPIESSHIVVVKNRVYLLGGRSNRVWSNTVYTALINEDGTLSEWSVANYLPATVSCSQVIVTKNRIYLLGGVVNEILSDTVYTSIINKDGTLEDWVTADPLPAAIGHSHAVVTKNRVYLLGGVINCMWSSATHVAAINEDGTLGLWVTTNPLPEIVVWAQAIVTKNRVYLLGGCVDSNMSSVVYTAPINADGTLGTWTLTNPLPKTIEFSQTVVVKNKVYMLGGFIDDDYSNTVYVADLPGGLNDYSEFY